MLKTSSFRRVLPEAFTGIVTFGFVFALASVGPCYADRVGVHSLAGQADVAAAPYLLAIAFAATAMLNSAMCRHVLRAYVLPGHGRNVNLDDQLPDEGSGEESRS